MSDLSTTQTILRQLGGGLFVGMTGAKQFVSIAGRTLQFKLPARFAKNGINLIRVTLDDSDTYTMEFCKYAKLDARPVARHEGLYGDMLQATFREETGLDTHL